MPTIDDFHRDILLPLDDFNNLTQPEISSLEGRVDNLLEFIQSSQNSLTDGDLSKLHEIHSRFKAISKEKPDFQTLNERISKIFINIAEIQKTDSPIPKERSFAEKLNELLHTPPKRPEKSNKVDETKLEQWVDKHPGNVKEAVRALSTQVTHITQEEFEFHLKTSVIDFNTRILKLGGSDFEYFAGIEEGKSNLWVAQLAFHQEELEHKPLGAIPLAYGEFLKHSKNPPKNIVLFDDAVFSGEQMARTISGIANEAERDEHPLEKIFVVCPLMTTRGKAKLEQLKIPCELEIFSSKIIPSISEALKDSEYLKTLEQMYSPSSKRRAREKEEVPDINTKITSVLSLTYFDHKIPDDRSFLSAISEGTVKNISKRNVDSVPVLPKTNPPYKMIKEDVPIEQPEEEDLESIRSSFSSSSALHSIGEEEEN